MNESIQLIKLTKKYIIEYLNGVVFENKITWDGVDNFNKLKVLSNIEDKDDKEEQRGGLLVHHVKPIAFRLLVTVFDKGKQEVCYRIVGIKEKLNLDDPQKVCLPTVEDHVDFSISDLNLGIDEISSYSFCDNKNGGPIKVFSLLKCLLNCSLYNYYDESIFDNLLGDIQSYPPVAGDDHYQPVFGV